MNKDNLKATLAAHLVSELGLMTITEVTTIDHVYLALSADGWFWNAKLQVWTKQLALPGFGAIVGNSNPYQQ